MQTGYEIAGNSMIWELLIICGTILLLFGDYMKQKARALDIENDRRDEENLHNGGGL